MSATRPNPVSALCQFLESHPEVGPRVGTHVYGGELPRKMAQIMPTQAVMVRASGGLGAFGRAYQDYEDSRYDVRCYGSNPLEAYELCMEVDYALKNLRRTRIDNCLLHWARSAGGRFPVRDPDTDWPSYVSPWQVLAATIPAE